MIGNLMSADRSPPARRWVARRVLCAFALLAACDTIDTPIPQSHRTFPLHLGSKHATLFHPYVDFVVEDVTYIGNPFDILIGVLFTHPASGKQIRSLAFYDGDWNERTATSTVDRWVIRFTGVRLGEWTFATSSDNHELNGLTGTIHVSEQPNAKVQGPKSVDGTWFKTKDSQGNSKPWFPLIYYNAGRASGYESPPPAGRGDYSWVDFPWSAMDLPYDDDARLHDMITVILYGDESSGQLGLTDIGANLLFFGASGVTMMHHGIWEWPQAAEYWDGSRGMFTKMNPDVRTFHIIETVYDRLAAEGIGMKSRLWDGSWSHLQGPRELEGGINGPTDRRLQRYIAARLGPLVNYHFDYGADLYDGWIARDEIHEWSSYLKQHSGWMGLHTVREWQDTPRNPDGFWLSASEKLDYVNINEAPRQRNIHDDVSRWPFADPPAEYPDSRWVRDYYDLTLYWRNETGYGYPLYYGALFLYKRTHGNWHDEDTAAYQYWDMQRTRRFLWQVFMQEGGFATWGRLWFAGDEAPQYPEPMQFKIFSTFVKNYLRAAYRGEKCVAVGYCLTSHQGATRYYIVYAEDVSVLEIDLTGLRTVDIAMAVKTTASSYEERAIAEELSPGEVSTWYPEESGSDWTMYIEGRTR